VLQYRVRAGTTVAAGADIHEKSVPRREMIRWRVLDRQKFRDTSCLRPNNLTSIIASQCRKLLTIQYLRAYLTRAAVNQWVSQSVVHALTPIQDLFFTEVACISCSVCDKSDHDIILCTNDAMWSQCECFQKIKGWN